jgi:hypothetical protein
LYVFVFLVLSGDRFVLEGRLDKREIFWIFF